MRYQFIAIFITTIILTTLIVGFQTSFAVGPPEPITDLIAVPANGEVHLIWTAPYDNGEPIQNYKVIMWKTGSDATTTFPNIIGTKAVPELNQTLKIKYLGALRSLI